MKNKAHHAEINETKNDITLDTRAKIIDLLQQSVANGADLFYAARTAHFNVKGPSFGTLHALFETIYTYVDTAVDDLAERAVQLGGQMQTTLRHMAAQSQLEEYPTDLRDGMGHCEAMSERLSAFGKHIRDNIDTADEAGDADTADLYTEISRQIDKFTWMVEAHIQADK